MKLSNVSMNLSSKSVVNHWKTPNGKAKKIFGKKKEKRSDDETDSHCWIESISRNKKHFSREEPKQLIKNSKPF